MVGGKQGNVARELGGPRRRLTLAAVCVAIAVGCSENAERTRARSERLIDGDPAPSQTGTVWLSHPVQAFVCSGVVVHPKLVVTTQHCVFASRPEGERMLSASGFRIGFGTSEESQVFRGVAAVEWVGAPLANSVESSVAMGLDIALLELTTPVPSGTHIQAIAWDYAAQAGQEFLMVGFGLSSLTLGTAGVRRSALGVITGFEPTSGVIQLQGKSACFGDSGGPILFGNSQQWVGAISQIGGSSTARFCDIGLTFGATLLNPDVRALLQRSLAKAGACPAEVCDNQQDEDCDGTADNGCDTGSAEGGRGGASGSASEVGAGGFDPKGRTGGVRTAGGTQSVEPGSDTTMRPPVHVGTLDPAPMLTPSFSPESGGAPNRGGAPGSVEGNVARAAVIARGGCALGGNAKADSVAWIFGCLALLRRVRSHRHQRRCVSSRG